MTDAVQLHPPTEFVSKDIPCLRCGYNLRGLPPDGRCPECGFWVAETVERSGWCADRETVRSVREAVQVLTVTSAAEIFLLAVSSLSNYALAFAVAAGLFVVFVSGVANASAMVHLRDLLPRAPRRVPWTVIVLASALILTIFSSQFPRSTAVYAVLVAWVGLLPLSMAFSVVRVAGRWPDGAIQRVARWTAGAAVVFSIFAIASPCFGPNSPASRLAGGTGLFSAVDWIDAHIILASAAAFVVMRVFQIVLCYRLRGAVDRWFR